MVMRPAATSSPVLPARQDRIAGHLSLLSP